MQGARRWMVAEMDGGCWLGGGSAGGGRGPIRRAGLEKNWRARATGH
jgi:hypothetical protein